jgi:membrane fusion protein, copper/silver efflux system
MRRTLWVFAVFAVILTAGIGGFWLGHQGVLTGVTALGQTQASSLLPSGPVIYYQDPDGKPLYSADPMQTPDGRPYRAVLASEDLSFDMPAKASGDVVSAPGGKKIRYYRNPMGLPDVSPTPKKDSMGMDYIAVYEGDDDVSVKMTPGKVQRLGAGTCVA